jgi:hypothetical protein
LAIVLGDEPSAGATPLTQAATPAMGSPRPAASPRERAKTMTSSSQGRLIQVLQLFTLTDDGNPSSSTNQDEAFSIASLKFPEFQFFRSPRSRRSSCWVRLGHMEVMARSRHSARDNEEEGFSDMQRLNHPPMPLSLYIRASLACECQGGRREGAYGRCFCVRSSSSRRCLDGGQVVGGSCAGGGRLAPEVGPWGGVGWGCGGKKAKNLAGGARFFEVGVRGFEPRASCSRSKRATRLRYTPMWVVALVPPKQGRTHIATRGAGVNRFLWGSLRSRSGRRSSCRGC